jgi:hypothetical protein
LVAVGLAAAFGLPGAAFAAPYLTPNPNNCPANNCVQLLEDNDWEVLLRPNTSGLNNGYDVLAVTQTTVIQPGDVFAGLLQIQQTELVAPLGGGDVENLQGSNPTFTALFLVRADTVTCTGGSCGVIDGSTDTLTFNQAGTAAWKNIFGSGGLLNVTGAGYTDPDNGLVNADTMAVLFYGDAFNTQDPTLASLSASASTFIDGGTMQHEFGFVPGAAGQFWRTNGTDAALPIFSGTSKPNNDISINITRAGAGPALDYHNYRGLVAGDALYTAPVQLQGNGQVTGVAAGTSWGVTTDTDLFIRPIPEPGTMLLVGLSLVGLGIASRRRNVL